MSAAPMRSAPMTASDFDIELSGGLARAERGDWEMYRNSDA
jgi:hypothetical protein